MTNLIPYYEEPGITIYHGDCRDILPHLPKVDLVLTDPPYGHGNMHRDLQAARVGVHGARQREAEPILNDGIDLLPLMNDVFTILPQILERDCCCCCCCGGGGGPSPTFAWFANRMDEVPWSFFHALIWDKSGRGNGLGWRYRRNYEFVMVAHLRGGRLLWSDDSVAVPNVLRFQPEINRLHPNEKPVSMFQTLASLHGPGTILDPFMGSGTTLVAAKNLGRKAIGIEIEEKYCKIAVERLRQDVLPFNRIET